MWRRMHKKEAFDYHHSNFYSNNSCMATNNLNNCNNDEANPFISVNRAQSSSRVNFSATRQLNNSPSFQRVHNVAQSSKNTNHNNNALNSHFNSLSRSRYYL